MALDYIRMAPLANMSPRTQISQMDGRRWCFSPQDQTLSYSMGVLVGKFLRLWKHAELKARYIRSCRDPGAADFAAKALRQYRITELHSYFRQMTARVTPLELAA